MVKIIWTNGDEAKRTEEKREKMNSIVGLNNISIKDWPILYINDWCAEHIKRLHKKNPNEEWLAYCKVKSEWEGIFIMTDMVFPWQTTTGWDVETTKEWMEWLNKELIARWEKATDWNCVLHSHHKMGCFWSGTDDKARLSLNDWRQLAWAVVTAYEEEWNVMKINYKGCLNFYKPYNIEIDATVENLNSKSIADEYDEYLTKIIETEEKYYNMLKEENKEYIDKITDKPSFNGVLEYLGLDIEKELNRNFDGLREKIWNPELLDYLKQLRTRAGDLALTDVNSSGVYSDMLVEYGEFCNWSEKLLEQLEENKEKKTFGTLSSIQSPSLLSQTASPLNRDFNDNDDDDYDYYYRYEFISDYYDEYTIRQMFGISHSIPMKVGECGEWCVWDEDEKDYVYVEEWHYMMYDY